MANGTGTGGSVMTTGTVSLSTGGGLIVAQWLVHPVWPPPDAVLTLVVAALAPFAHLVGRAIYRKLSTWAEEEPAPPPPQPQGLIL